MGLFGKLFGGGGNTIDAVRKAVKEKRFADGARIADDLDIAGLSSEEQNELVQLQAAAGDGLARLNLDEALGLRHCGKGEQAEEYFQLALEKVCSDELKAEIEQVRAGRQQAETVEKGGSGLSGCSSCSSGQVVELEDYIAPEDVDQQMELILTSYPDDLAERYLGKGKTFQEAFLLAQCGQESESLNKWAQVEKQEQDDLYFFELGSLLARVGELGKAKSLLEKALKINPALMVAVDALLPVLLADSDYKGAEKQLRKLVESGSSPAYCHAQLASVYARQGEMDKAVDEIRIALKHGNKDQAFLVFAAALFERRGDYDEAERLLELLPASGCKGGINLPLAEFWLRRKRELGRILDTFNAACREDPQNPRWQLRVAQTYMARNWKKDGIKLLKKVVDDPRLDKELAEEARLLLDEAQV